jgi:hypothetical protein
MATQRNSRYNQLIELQHQNYTGEQQKDLQRHFERELQKHLY